MNFFNKILQTVLIVLTISVQVHGQTLEQLIKQLTNSNHRVWNLKQSESKEYLGDSCDTGLQYTFIIKNQVVIKKQCIDHHWKNQSLKWSITAKSPDYWLTIGNTSYQIQFVKKGSNIMLRLRQFDKSAINITTDLYFDPI